MKRTILTFMIFSTIVLSSNIMVFAESPAHLVTTISGGIGLTAKVRNEGNMTARNITYGCIIFGALIDRNLVITRKLPDMVPKKEFTVHSIFFFFGKISVGGGALQYFNGEEDGNYTINMQDGFAIGPFVKLLN